MMKIATRKVAPDEEKNPEHFARFVDVLLESVGHQPTRSYLESCGKPISKADRVRYRLGRGCWVRVQWSDWRKRPLGHGHRPDRKA